MAALLTMYFNKHLPDGEMPYRPQDLVPYLEDPLDEELSREELLAKIGVGRFGRKHDPA